MTIECFADSARGQYIPQFFAESILPECVSNVSDADMATLKAGPDAEGYWDSWASVLDNARITDKAGRTWTLYHDGDLFMVSDDASESERAQLMGDL